MPNSSLPTGAGHFPRRRWLCNQLRIRGALLPTTRKAEKQPRGYELDPAEVTFESGQKADSNVLTKQYIYNNDVGSREGARVFTSVGRYIDKC